MGDTFYVWVNVDETERPEAVLDAIRRVMYWTDEGRLHSRDAYGFYFDKECVGARGEHDLCAGATPASRYAELVEAVRTMDPNAKVRTEWLLLDNLPVDMTERFGGEEDS